MHTPDLINQLIFQPHQELDKIKAQKGFPREMFLEWNFYTMDALVDAQLTASRHKYADHKSAWNIEILQFTTFCEMI